MSGIYSNAPCTKAGYKNSITVAILKEFLVNSLFHETKIPIIDMKVLMFFIFLKKIQKKKPPNSKKIGRFHPSKCKDKVQKLGAGSWHIKCQFL